MKAWKACPACSHSCYKFEKGGDCPACGYVQGGGGMVQKCATCGFVAPRLPQRYSASSGVTRVVCGSCYKCTPETRCEKCQVPVVEGRTICFACEPGLFADEAIELVNRSSKTHPEPRFINVSNGGALDRQEGGDHYTKLAIQPMEYCHRNSLDAPALKVIKYVTRWRDKDGLDDLRKAKHALEVWIELEEKHPTLEAK